ncbi:hypothetical protein ACFW0U_18460, partial [Streptomyces albidoflavus]
MARRRWRDTVLRWRWSVRAPGRDATGPGCDELSLGDTIGVATPAMSTRCSRPSVRPDCPPPARRPPVPRSPCTS